MASLVFISNFPATQPVSALTWPLPTGASTSALQTTGNVSLASLDSKLPAGLTVTNGKLLVEAAAATGGATEAQQVFQTALLTTIDSKLAGSIAVTGVFYPATQPVSGSISISNFPSSQAVTGSFFQATQPISAAALPLPSGAATSALQTTGNTSLGNIDTKTPALGQAVMASSSPVVIASNQSAVPVSGTVAVSNFPATQPVSGTVTATGPLTDTQLRATPVPISGTVTATGPLTDTQIRATALPVSGPLTDTQIRATALPVSGPLTDTQLRASAVPVSVPTLTKGTQSANGLSTQHLKDAGRNQTNYFMAAQIVSTATDALMSLTGYKSGAAVVATATPAVVTAGKTYRVTSIVITYVTIVTTPGAVRFTLRANTGGTVLIGSPAVMSWTVGEPTGIAPVAGKFNTIVLTFPDGIEFAAGTGIGLSMVGIGATGAAAVVGYGIADINGFEY